MKLQLAYDSGDDIPENYRELYDEKDGKFVLSGIEGIRTDDDISRLQTALARERESHSETRKKMKTMREPPKTMREPPKDASPDSIENTPALMYERDMLKQERDEIMKRVRELEQDARRRKISDKVRAAASTAGVVDTALEDIIIISERVFDIGEDGNVHVGSDVRGHIPGQTPEAWITEMKDKRPHWWGPSRGGGATGSGSGTSFPDNPWAEKTWNLTEQMRQYIENPDVARRMAATEGKKIEK